MSQIFPKEFINTTVEHYTFRLRRPLLSIYIIIVASLTFILASLPFIKTDVSISANGIVSTPKERFELKIPFSGKILRNRLEENLFITQGDTLVVFDSSVLQKDLFQINSRLTKLKGFSKDLIALVNKEILDTKQLRTSRYKIDFSKYQTELEKLLLEKKALDKVINRQKKLFEAAAISESEYDQAETNHNRVAAEIELFIKQAINTWKETHLSIEQEIQELSFRKKEIENELLKSVLLAPVSGEIQSIVPVSKNQFVVAGSKIGEITPIGDIVAICWLTPKDIGLIQEGMSGLFQVDAFNPNEWGYVSGVVEEISSDTYLINSQPLFKVVCRLDNDKLTLKNGVEGALKKGMTLSASFLVTERSLYQLLYDKVDDWVNPKRT